MIKLVKEGWTGSTHRREIKPFWRRRDELALHLDILMWGSRVVVPKRLQQKLLPVLHEGHIGVVKMKGLVRSCMWWPHIDKHIEDIARTCSGCQETAEHRKGDRCTVGNTRLNLGNVYMWTLPGFWKAKCTS